MARANAIYYTTHDPFADFTTSPEISQVFGEIIGLWSAITWQLLGSPSPVSLVEAGPGRGTLMADALRAIRRAAPAFASALRVHLIETSPRLRAAQAARIPDAAWHDDLSTVPDAPLILLANEFLDALPIRQFIRRAPAGPNASSPPANGSNSQPTQPTCPPQGQPPKARSLNSTNRPAHSSPPSPPACAVIGAPPCCSTTAHQTARAGESLQALADKRPVNPLSQAGFSRPDRPCRLRRPRRHRPQRRRRCPGTTPAGRVPDRARSVPTHRTPRANPTRSGGGADRGRATTGRSRGNGASVQSHGDEVAALPRLARPAQSAIAGKLIAANYPAAKPPQPHHPNREQAPHVPCPVP